MGVVVPTLAPEVHRAARGVIRQAWQAVHGEYAPTVAELQASQAVGAYETRYGRAPFRGVFGERIPNEHNWGSVHAVGDQRATCGTTDARPDNTRYRQCMRAYDSDLEGAADLVRHLTKLRPLTWQAMKAGAALYDVSDAMRLERYYGGWCLKAVGQYGPIAASAKSGPAYEACRREAVAQHADVMAAWCAQIASAMGEPAFPRGGPPPPSGGPLGGADGGTIGPALVVGGAGLLALYLWGRA